MNWESGPQNIVVFLEVPSNYTVFILVLAMKMKDSDHCSERGVRAVSMVHALQGSP